MFDILKNFKHDQKNREKYPIQFSQGLNYTRLPTGYGIRPYPPMIGAVSGILPLYDVRQIGAIGHVPWGVSAEQATPMFSQAIYPNMSKVKR